MSFRNALQERDGAIRDVGDLSDAGARRTIDASGLYILPFAPPGASSSTQERALAPEQPAYFHLSRDPQGRNIVWTLAGSVDPKQPAPKP